MREDDDNAYTAEGDPVEDKDGNDGINAPIRDQVISPETAATATTTLASVVTSGTGENAQTGEPTWGKTGTTDNNGDAWFCGATEEITACVWVGHADSNEPMLTEYSGNPVDGGTFPAGIFADVVNAYLSTIGAEDPEGDETTTDPAIETETTAPTTTDTSEPEAATDTAPTEEPAPEAPPAEDVSGGAIGAERRG